MKLINIILFLILYNCFLTKGISQTPLTHDVLQTVFFIRINSETGTGFVIGGPHKNFLVTARHLLKGHFANLDSLEYYVHGGGVWNKYKGKVLLHSNSKVDIAIIESDSVSGWKSPYNSKFPQAFIGEDVIFLGFPYQMMPSRNFSDGEIYYPLPIPKKAMFSAITEIEGIVHYLFDGHNNPGYSGGPIICKNPNAKPIPYYQNLLAVVSGLYTGDMEIKTDKGILKFTENSGIMIGVSSQYIEEIFQQNGYISVW